jgi:hypothetical protein
MSREQEYHRITDVNSVFVPKLVIENGYVNRYKVSYNNPYFNTNIRKAVGKGHVRFLKLIPIEDNSLMLMITRAFENNQSRCIKYLLFKTRIVEDQTMPNIWLFDACTNGNIPLIQLLKS